MAPKKIALVTDSCADLSRALIEENDIHVIPLRISCADGEFSDGVDISAADVYTRLHAGELPKTSLPTGEDVERVLRTLVKEGYDGAIAIMLSSGLSGTYNLMRLCAQDVKDELDVRVYDSKSGSLGQGMTVLQLAEDIRSGISWEELTERRVPDLLGRVYPFFSVDTLEYLKKGGRITPAAAALGTLLRLKPVLQIQGEKLDAFAKARNVKQAKKLMIEAIHNDCIKRFGSDETGSHMWIHMAYTGTDTTAIHEFREEVAAKFPNHDIIVNPLSLSVSCHIGPGAIAVTCSKKLEEI